jgi:hypothetical protein
VIGILALKRAYFVRGEKRGSIKGRKRKKKSFYYSFEAQWLLYVPPAVSVTNCAFFQHS